MDAFLRGQVGQPATRSNQNDLEELAFGASLAQNTAYLDAVQQRLETVRHGFATRATRLLQARAARSSSPALAIDPLDGPVVGVSRTPPYDDDYTSQSGDASDRTVSASKDNGQFSFLHDVVRKSGSSSVGAGVCIWYQPQFPGKSWIQFGLTGDYNWEYEDVSAIATAHSTGMYGLTGFWWDGSAWNGFPFTPPQQVLWQDGSAWFDHHMQKGGGQLGDGIPPWMQRSQDNIFGLWVYCTGSCDASCGITGCSAGGGALAVFCDSLFVSEIPD
jgi:hypothetical protein